MVGSSPEQVLSNTKIDEQLSQEIIEMANKIDDHLSALEKIIKDGDSDKDIEKNHKALEEAVTVLLAKVTDEHVLSDEARVAMHWLQERIVQAEKSVENAQESSYENSTAATKAEQLIKKRKLPAALTIWIGKGIWEIRQQVKKEKWFRNKAWWWVKGIFSWLLRWWLTYAWASVLEYGAQLIDGLDPRNRAKNAKKSVSTWRNNLFRKTGERYDPENQAIQDARHDSNLEQDWLEWPELWMDDLNRPVFWWKDGRTEMAVIPNDILLPDVYKKDQVDALYGDPCFTDQYLLTITTVNMRTQAARKADQSGWIFSTKDSGIWSIQLREQELLQIQEDIQNQRPKEQILQSIKKLLNNIQSFEYSQKWVIWSERSNDVMPTITSYSIDQKDRENGYEAAQIKIYDAFRKTWGVTHGDSTVVKNRLYEDLLKKAKYEKMDDLFDGEAWIILFDQLKKISPETTSDEQIAKIVWTHLHTNNFLQNSGKKIAGLSETVIAKITESIITTYHKAQENINNNLGEFKKYFTRAYGLEIDTDQGQQQKMISAYEQMYGEETLTAYAEKNWLSYTENKRTVVRKYARDMVKQNALHGAVITAYQDVFFDHYLPTQRIVTWTQTSFVGTSDRVTTKNTYWYADKKEALLADVIWAGDDISDNTINSAINIGINIAASLIPVLWVEFAVARLAWGMVARGILTAWTISSRVAVISMRAVLWHIAMTTFSGVANEQSCGDILGKLTDRKEFAQNAIFFNVIWQVGPRIRSNVGKIPRWGKVNPATLEGISAHRLGKVAIMTWLWWAETAVVEWTRALLDPNFERNRGEVMTVFMLSTILMGRVWAKAREYTATKMPNGKIKMIPKDTARIAAKLESGSWGHPSLRMRYEQRLSQLAEWETTIMGETVVKTTTSGTTTYTIKWQSTVFHSPKEIIKYVKTTKFGAAVPPEQVRILRAEEMGAQVEKMVSSGKTFTRWWETYKFQVDAEWTVQIMKKWAKWFAPIAEQELQLLLKNNEKLIWQTSKKFFEICTQSKKPLADLRRSWKVNKKEFTDRCKTHNISRVENMFVGDFFKLLWEGKIRQLLFGKFKFNWLTSNQALIPTKTARRIVWTGKNAGTLFNIWSLLYGGFVGDDGDAGRDEWVENYLLYSVLWRWIIGKIALAIFDWSDIII